MAGDRAVLAGSGLPSSNRGVSEFRNADGTLTVGIDWFSASIDPRAALDEAAFRDGDSFAEVRQWIEFSSENARIAALQVFCWFFAGLGLELDEVAGGGRFYTWRVKIIDAAKKFVGMIELGCEECRRADGTYTARIELTGDGCKAIGAARCGHAKRWLELRAMPADEQRRGFLCRHVRRGVQGAGQRRTRRMGVGAVHSDHDLVLGCASLAVLQLFSTNRRPPSTQSMKGDLHGFRIDSDRPVGRCCAKGHEIIATTWPVDPFGEQSDATTARIKAAAGSPVTSASETQPTTAAANGSTLIAVGKRPLGTFPETPPYPASF